MQALKKIAILIGILTLQSINAQIAYRTELNCLLSDSGSFIAMFDDEENAIAIYTSLQSAEKPYRYKQSFQHNYIQYLYQTSIWGFNIENYDYSILDSLQKGRTAYESALLQIYTADSYLRLMEDIKNGLLKNETTRGKTMHFDLQSLNRLEELSYLIHAENVSYLRLAEPQSLAYQDLKSYLERYLSFSPFDTIQIESKDTLFYGIKYDEIANVRKKLFFLGDLQSKQRLRSTIFDKELLIAIQQFQQRHILPIDSFIDEKTIDYLNISLTDKLKDIRLTMERYRWLPAYLDNYYAFVNLPAFELQVVERDSLLMEQAIVCGKSSRMTPCFMDTMSYLDFNPTWTVPPTILQKDVLPAVKKNSAYLSWKNMKVLDVTTGHYVSAADIDWSKSKKYKIIQGPGISNALGVVKFIFPNNYYIFFHDTNHKEHFPLTYRAYSSGCIRLSEPIELAQLLLERNEESFSETAIDSIVDTQKTKRILLEEKPSVYIHYLTTNVKDKVLYHYPDVYKLNADLYKELNW